MRGPRPVTPWQAYIEADIAVLGGEKVLTAVMNTCDATDERGLSAEAKSALRWNNYCWWAIPRSLAVLREELLLIDGLYHRAWVCELNGVKVDGHVYVNEGSGCCQVCGE